MPAKVHLIDALPYVFRAYFSLPDSIETPKGAPANAVYGFASFLLRYLAEEEPTHVGVAFDKSLTTSFRNEIYPDYKAGRGLPPPELEAQQDACRAVSRALGFVTWVDERFEADDLIASATRKVRRGGHRVVIVSSDKDLAQLVEDEVELHDVSRERRFGPAAVVEHFGVRPGQIVDYLALAGDSVDDIPGVPGVGKKTAAQLLGLFEDLNALYADLEAVAGSGLRGAKGLAKRLEENEELARLSYRLAKLAPEAPARARLDELRWKGPRRAELEALFDELGFDSLKKRALELNPFAGA